MIKKTAKKRTRAAGIEPTLKVLETLVLPLNYARMLEDRDLSPRPLASTGDTHAPRILIEEHKISIHAPIHTCIHEYGSTFLHYCGLIGSHVVPIAHSVLSGLDNGPLIQRERSNNMSFIVFSLTLFRIVSPIFFLHRCVRRSHVSVVNNLHLVIWFFHANFVTILQLRFMFSDLAFEFIDNQVQTTVPVV